MATEQPTKRKAGRPRVEVRQHTPLRSVRVSDAEWSAWQARAAAKGVSISELIRQRMNAAK